MHAETLLKPDDLRDREDARERRAWVHWVLKGPVSACCQRALQEIQEPEEELAVAVPMCRSTNGHVRQPERERPGTHWSRTAGPVQKP
eukprot:6191779-Lingulodinium_polyedra.AAC.1